METTLKTEKLSGLVAATYTPIGDHGKVRVDQVPPMVEYLLSSGVTGLYVCGSTGEGMSLASDERKLVAEAFVNAADGRVPVIIQVGHNSLADARQLAAHAASIGADAISATCPSYFKITTIEGLVESMAFLAGGAADLPFYYYHIPILTGSSLEMVEFLQQASDAIPNLVGLKYTEPKLHDFQRCLELDGGRFDVVWGVDEMLLGALVTGAKAAIGSTYNIAAPLYCAIIREFSEGNLDEARRLQALAVNMIKTIVRHPFHPAMKQILKFLGFDFGHCRLPQMPLTNEQTDALEVSLRKIGFFEWRRAPAGQH